VVGGEELSRGPDGLKERDGGRALRTGGDTEEMEELGGGDFRKERKTFHIGPESSGMTRSEGGRWEWRGGGGPLRSLCITR